MKNEPPETPEKEPTVSKSVNKYSCFVVGMILLMVGLQFRFIDRVVLTPQATKFLAKYHAPAAAKASGALERLWPSAGPTLPRKELTPPSWIGLALLSVGAVLILQSLVMRKPEG